MRRSKYIRLRYIIITIVILTSFFAYQIVRAVGEPGSYDNPLVSKDYVDGKFAELLSKINELTQKVETHISESYVPHSEPKSEDNTSEPIKDEENSSKISNEMLGELTAQILSIQNTINDLSVELSKISARVVSLEHGDNTFISTALQQNQKIAEIELKVNQIQTKANEIQAGLDNISKQVNSVEAQRDRFEIIEMKSGQHLVLGASAEMLLRGGTGVAVGSNTGAGGLVDLTSGSGADIMGGQDIPLNHLLMSPRDDGRGLIITSETAWVMVKGAYTVK